MPPRDKATSSVSSCIGTIFVGMKVVPFCFILGNGVGDTKSPVKIKDFLKIKICRSHLIRYPSKTPFKVPFKNRFFVTRYPYPRSGALTIRIRVPYKGILCKEAVLKGCLKGGLRRVSY